MPLSSAVDPFARWAPRYWPTRQFPPYRYVPGRNAHPVRDPAGHSYEAEPVAGRRVQWEPSDWAHVPEWLWGVDLFNAFYFWEAHEAWEVLWAAKARDSIPAILLQGLIQVAAALLKIRLGSVPGATTLANEGLEKITVAGRDRPLLMGLDLRRVAYEFSNYFRPLLQRTLPPVDASVPLLTLSGALRV